MLAQTLQNDTNNTKSELDTTGIKPLEHCQQELRELGLSDSEIEALGDIIKKTIESIVTEKLINPLL